jgi:hypothetical protein
LDYTVKDAKVVAMIALRSFPVLGAVVCAALVLASCATATRLDAGADVHAFLVAIRDNDRATFNDHVDRPALKRQIEARLIAEARSSNLNSSGQMIAAILAGPAASLAGDALIQPRVFRSAAVALGYSPEKPIPGRLSIAQALRYTGPGEVCVAKDKQGPCLLVFEYDGATWRLTNFGGDLADIRRELGR